MVYQEEAEVLQQTKDEVQRQELVEVLKQVALEQLGLPGWNLEIEDMITVGLGPAEELELVALAQGSILLLAVLMLADFEALADLFLVGELLLRFLVELVVSSLQRYSDWSMGMALSYNILLNHKSPHRHLYTNHINLGIFSRSHNGNSCQGGKVRDHLKLLKDS